jgi:alpha-L-rhamnosidase
MWVWVGDPSPSDLCEQLRDLVRVGVAEALVLPFAPLTRGFLTERWFELLEAVVGEASELGIRLWLNGDYGPPVGEGRVVTERGPKSLVLESYPGARMRSLALEISQGCATLYTPPPDVAVAVIGRPDSDGAPIPESLQQIARPTVVEEDWLVYEYRLVETVGVDGGLVDLMSQDATDAYIREVLDAFDARIGHAFGSTIVGIYLDHEGSYGANIAWTPELFTLFRERYGYPLEPLLPLLGSPNERSAARVRFDYLELVSDLYADCFFARIREWCDARGLILTGHVFEESMQLLTDHVGDMFKVQRAMTLPGVDSLFDWGQSPRHLKEAASVAWERDVALTCENQNCLGMDSYRDLEKLRRTTNALVMWGVSKFFPGIICADERKVTLPNGHEQPWWPNLGLYADIVARGSFINTHTRAAPDVLLFHPRDDFRVLSAPMFEPNVLTRRESDPTGAWSTAPEAIFRQIIAGFEWGNEADAHERGYAESMDALSESQWDFLVADDIILSAVGSRLPLPKAIVLPPMRYLRLEDAQALRHLHDQGVFIAAVGELPGHAIDPSSDLAIRISLDAIFVAGTGRLVDSAVELGPVLDALLSSDVSVRGEHRRDIRVARRSAEDDLLYWVYNNAQEPVTVDVTSRDQPRAWWSVDSGLRIGAAGGETTFGPSELRLLVRDEATPPPSAGMQQRHVKALRGPWKFSVNGSLQRIQLPTRITRTLDEGLDAGWHQADYNDAYWPRVTLGPENLAERSWNVIGMFDNWDWRGLSTPYSPEDPALQEGVHRNEDGSAVAWRPYLSDTAWINLDRAVSGYTGAGMFDRGETAYALAYVHVAERVDAELRVAADSCVDVWLAGEPVHHAYDHKQFIEPVEGFANRVPVTLEPGVWPVLLKVSRGKRAYLGGMGFLFRICDSIGDPLPSVRVTTTKDPEQPNSQRDELVWQRLVVPAGVSAFDVAQGVRHIFVDGSERSVHQGFAVSPGQVIVLVRDPAQGMHRPLTFRPGETDVALGSWTRTGLQDHVGSGTYRGTFDHQGDLGRAAIDLGVVGVIAEVTLNGASLGTAAWTPYVFDASEALQAGTNEIRINVSNTGAAKRAAMEESRIWNIVSSGPRIWDSLERNGLLGPVSLVVERDA